MLIALFVSAPVLLATNPPQPSPFIDTGRRFASVEACNDAGYRETLSIGLWRCREHKGAF